MKKENEKLNIVFFGTPKFSVQIMEKLKGNDLTPSLLITTPNKPKGRKLILTPPETKIWAEENKIKVLQPTKLKDPEFLKEMSANNWDLFIVASYGKIIPKEILDMPKYGTINVHPSLLPRLRGASPMQSAILSEDKTGVTIMLMDEEMDHGPILIQKDLEIDNWPPNIEELEEKLIDALRQRQQFQEELAAAQQILVNQDQTAIEARFEEMLRLSKEGNLKAQKIIKQVFTTSDSF